jgi:hypothetical protein
MFNIFKKKIRYQLIIAKNKDGFPEMINVSDDPSNPKMVQDMDIICKDYPLNIPIMIFNQGELGVPVGSPLLVFNDQLYSVYNFTQVEERLINIFVLPAGDPKLSPIAKKE